MSRVLVSLDPTPNDVTRMSQTFHSLFGAPASRRIVRRQTTIVALWRNA
jgi:hypothetical protein